VDLVDFVDPVTAPCGHTLCRGCYISWVAQARAGAAPACPTCRAPLAREPPAINISLRSAQAAAAQRRPAPALAIIAEADLRVDMGPQAEEATLVADHGSSRVLQAADHRYRVFTREFDQQQEAWRLARLQELRCDRRLVGLARRTGGLCALSCLV
jgi:hypothetical protein